MATQDSTTVVNVYMWGMGIRSLEEPYIEELNHFIFTHREKLKTQDRAGVEEYITYLHNTQGIKRNFFVGTSYEWETYKLKYAEIMERAGFGQEAVVDAIMFTTLATYASLYKNGKIVEILTVLNQLARANLDMINTITINQDYEKLVHSMLIEMYTNHRELYTAMFFEAKLQEEYETNIVKNFLKRIFINKYLLSETTK